MSVSPLDTTQTHSAMQKQGMEVQQRNITSLGGSMLSEAEKSEKLRDACEGFESIFIQKMWQQMRATLPKENPLVGREEKFWQGLYDQELSKKMAESGGIGLADMMYEQLARNLLSASSTTAASVSATTPVNSGFSIDAVPLMPRQIIPPMASSHGDSQSADVHTADATKPDGMHGAASIYEGAAPRVGAEEGTTGAGAAAANASAPQATGFNPVQQFMSALQQKQAPQSGVPGTNGQMVQPGGMTAAQLAHYQAGSLSSQGILPPSPQAGHVVRTTYTTNMPQGAQGGDKAHQEVMRQIDAARLAEQIAAANTLQNTQGVQVPAPTTPAPVLTAASVQQSQAHNQGHNQGQIIANSATQAVAPAIAPVVAPVIAPSAPTSPLTAQAPYVPSPAPLITEQGIVEQGGAGQGMGGQHMNDLYTPVPTSPTQASAPTPPTAPSPVVPQGTVSSIRPIVPAGSIVSSSGVAPAAGSMAPYDPVTPYAPSAASQRSTQKTGV